jgi:PIN domain nuclease of toxin-antitoxin system
VIVRAVADTHALIWLLHKDPRLSALALSTILATEKAGEWIGVFSMTLIELAYLEEKGRIPARSYAGALSLLNRTGGTLREQPVTQKVADALRLIDRKPIPEMPDRVIAATALMLGVPLISCDHKILASSVPTLW